ncbi:hypothetical protein [Autumnicola psychrophila]|uniref:Uncharacterized protein n=1 Tax=Autumnicola psychrophila TaxID=3075592 RepID=A0ABU3DPW4_9FLAO|nr:hypothetical protein [Zunongwangia sp. F225]MDT0685760.1 hypothetical protein [Zunongwangia sp. F225]
MKQISGILLLLCFALRPLYQVVNITYYQFNIDLIIEKYCVNKDKPAMQCNGKCHLNSQLDKFENSKDDRKSTISSTFLPVYFQQAFTYKVAFQNIELLTNNWKIPQLFSTKFIQGIEHPPNLSV